MWATRDVITGTLYKILDFGTPTYNYKLENIFATKALFLKTHMTCLVLNLALIPAVTEPSNL